MDIRVVELFAGVGGFRLGLENSSKKFKTIWANQWEPNKNTQHAFDCYSKHFGFSENHINKNISDVKDLIPKHDLLVGGFPCQDYSVARTQAKGIEGKKGVLWWDIKDIIETKKPKFVLLENVDRLLKSPSSQRGRDFGIILKCFQQLGYSVEWRVINAADYGHPQRRRRVFIFASRLDSIWNATLTTLTPAEIYFKTGFFASEFKVEKEALSTTSFIKYDFSENQSDDLVDFSNKFSAKFLNAGYMINGEVFTREVKPIPNKPTTLGEILESELVDERYFLNGSLEKWTYLKGSKRIERLRPNGEPYFYSEGGMTFPDFLDKPARTMLTSESSVNRSTHVVSDLKTGRLRVLTPLECERLNGFPDNWTDTGMPEKFRYFVMGNALVVPVIQRIGKKISSIN